MQDGNHGVRTAWGVLAVRLPLPEDKQWAADRATILEALGDNAELARMRRDGTYDRLWKKYFADVEANLVKP